MFLFSATFFYFQKVKYKFQKPNYFLVLRNCNFDKFYHLLKHLFIFFIAFLYFSLNAQEPVSIHLTEENGLPDKEFYSITEDRKGFIWLSADKGLFRYDGKNFKNYTNKSKRGISVFNVKEDALGRIWCNNISGQFFYVENNQLITFIDLGKKLNGELTEFLITDTFLIAFAKHTIFYVHLQTKKITEALKTSFVFGIPYQTNKQILFASLNQLILLKSDTLNRTYTLQLPKLKKGKRYVVDHKSEIFKLNSTFFLKENYQQKNSFYQLNLNGKIKVKVKGLEALKKFKNLTFFENNSKLWVTTKKGVYIFSYKNKTFILEKQILQKYYITKITKDKDGNFWLTTLNNGVFVLPNIAIKRLNISKFNLSVNCLEKIDSTKLLFGTNNGNVAIYDTKTHSEKIIQLPLNNKVSAIKHHFKKKISFISKQNKGFVFNHKTQKTTPVKNFYTTKSFSIIDEDSLLYVNFANANLLNIKYLNRKGKSIQSNRRAYTSFYDANSKKTYIAYVDELVSYNRFWKPKPIRFKNQPIFANTLSKTNDTILWVGTFKDGVFAVKNDKVINYFNTQNGLLSNKIEKIKADNYNVWIATDKGIQFLNTNTKKFKTLTKRDGIISYDISGIEALDHQIIFSSNKGLFSIEKAKVFKKQKPRDLYFTQVEINEIETEIKSNYKLNYNQNNIQLAFNVNGFQFGQKGRYKYRLLGLQNNWVTTKANINSVKYNNLPSGNFTFEVKPFLSSESNNNIKSISFSIQKPFWETWWLRILILSVVMGVTVLFFKRKIKKRELLKAQEIKQLSVENELITLKLENLRSQMNPHFIFNALNSIQEYIVLNQKNLASDYLGKFADLIRVYLDKSTKGKITLQEEINCLEMYLELEKLRFEDKLHYSIETERHINLDYVYIPTMLIQPYVENALKHGLLHRKSDRILKISFCISTSSKTVKCIIKDNGIGRKKAKVYKAIGKKNHKSFATKATQDRLALLNYGKEKQIGVTIIDLMDNNEAIGTQVNIIIPYTAH